jgi:hypothetical protein
MQIPPDERGHGEEPDRFDHVESDAIAEQFHRHNRQHREVLCDVRGCGIAPEKRPVPADDDAALEEAHAVDRFLIQRRPVVPERDL